MSVNYIKPFEMKKQITTSNQALKKENKEYSIIQTQATKLSKDQKLKGKSWNSLKKIYRSYASAAKWMVEANKATIEANNKLGQRMGTETLIRPQILESIRQLEDTIRREEEFLEATSHISGRCSGLWSMRNQARQTIAYCRKTIRILKGKLTRMKEIEQNTKSLYNKASKYYDKADKKVKKIKDRWNGTSAQLMVAKKQLDSSVASIKQEQMGENVYDIIMSLREAMEENEKELQIDLEMLHRGIAEILKGWHVSYVDGEFSVDRDMMYAVVKKESDAITDDEYAALAYVMITVDNTEILDEILRLSCMISAAASDLRTSIVTVLTEKLYRLFEMIEAFMNGELGSDRIIMREVNEQHIEDVLTGKVTLMEPETKTEAIGVEL